MTPEPANDVAFALELSRQDIERHGQDSIQSLQARALLAEHERAERLEMILNLEREARQMMENRLKQDTARWRAVRRHAEVVVADAADELWILSVLADGASPIPATVDEAADRLIQEQEKGT